MKESNNNEENILQIFEMIYLYNLNGKTCFDIGN